MVAGTAWGTLWTFVLRRLSSRCALEAVKELMESGTTAGAVVLPSLLGH